MATSTNAEEDQGTYFLRFTVHRRKIVDPSNLMFYGWVEALVEEGLIPSDMSRVEVSVRQVHEPNPRKARTDIEIYEM